MIDLSLSINPDINIDQDFLFIRRILRVISDRSTSLSLSPIMGLKYYSNLIDLPIYSNQQSPLSSSRSDIYTSYGINEQISKNIYANLSTIHSSNRTFYENIQRHSASTASTASSSPLYMNLNTTDEQTEPLFPTDLETNILADCSSTPTNTQVRFEKRRETNLFMLISMTFVDY